MKNLIISLFNKLRKKDAVKTQSAPEFFYTFGKGEGLIPAATPVKAAIGSACRVDTKDGVVFYVYMGDKKGWRKC